MDDDKPGKARSGWYLGASAIGVALSIGYWYPRLGGEERQGWLRILMWIFFGILIPGLSMIAILATVRLYLDKKRARGKQ